MGRKGSMDIVSAVEVMLGNCYEGVAHQLKINSEWYVVPSAFIIVGFRCNLKKLYFVYFDIRLSIGAKFGTVFEFLYRVPPFLHYRVIRFFGGLRDLTSAACECWCAYVCGTRKHIVIRILFARFENHMHSACMFMKNTTVIIIAVLLPPDTEKLLIYCYSKRYFLAFYCRSNMKVILHHPVKPLH